MLSDNAKRKADEAKAKGVWLFCPQYKMWYSPEEFKHAFSYANASDDFLQQLELRHPLDGLDAGFQRLQQTQEKLQIFAKRVMDYYSKNAGGK